MKDSEFVKCNINALAPAAMLRNNDRTIHYLKLTKEITRDDVSGRRTTIAAGSRGYILDEAEIVLLAGATWDKKQKLIDEMMHAHTRDMTYAFVSGYPCALQRDEFELLEKEPGHCIGELI